MKRDLPNIVSLTTWPRELRVAALALAASLLISAAAVVGPAVGLPPLRLSSPPAKRVTVDDSAKDRPGTTATGPRPHVDARRQPPRRRAGRPHVNAAPGPGSTPRSTPSAVRGPRVEPVSAPHVTREPEPTRPSAVDTGAPSPPQPAQPVAPSEAQAPAEAAPPPPPPPPPPPLPPLLPPVPELPPVDTPAPPALPPVPGVPGVGTP